MRNLKTIFIWMIISFGMQTGVLYYFNNYCFTDNTNATFKNVKQDIPTSTNNLEIKLPKDAKKIQLSPSSKYASYYLESTLHVINLNDGKDNAIESGKSCKSSFAKWHDSEDKMIILEKRAEGGMKVHTYQAKNNLKQEALDANNTSRTYALPARTANITDMQLNTLNTILYIKLTSNDYTSISRLDISDEMRKLPINSKKSGNFFLIKQDDAVVFEDAANQNAYMFNSSKSQKITIDGVDKSRLLYADNDGNVYMGHLKNDKIEAIFYKNCSKNDKSTKWEKIELKKPTEPDDIRIFNLESMYVVDKERCAVTNVKNGKEAKFTGTFETMNCNTVLSSDGEKAHIVSLK